MKDLKNIGKVVGCLIAFLLFFYIYFFRLSPSKEEIEETVLEECVPLQYDFKIISGYDNRYYNFEGKTKEGRIVKFKLQRHWSLQGLYSEGDSIHKLSGEKELYLIKPDTVIRLPLKVHGEEI